RSAREVVLEDLLMRPAVLGVAERAVLGHSDAVPPAVAVQREQRGARGGRRAEQRSAQGGDDQKGAANHGVSIGSAPGTLKRVAAGSVFYHHFSRSGVS